MVTTNEDIYPEVRVEGVYGSLTINQIRPNGTLSGGLFTV